MPQNTKTGNYYHIKIANSQEGNEFRTIDISSDKGIKATYDVTGKKITSYLFAKDKWSEGDAKEKASKMKTEGVVTTESVIDLAKQLSENIKSDIGKIIDGSKLFSEGTTHDYNKSQHVMGIKKGDNLITKSGSKISITDIEFNISGPRGPRTIVHYKYKTVDGKQGKEKNTVDVVAQMFGESKGITDNDTIDEGKYLKNRYDNVVTFKKQLNKVLKQLVDDIDSPHAHALTTGDDETSTLAKKAKIALGKLGKLTQ